MIDYKIDRFIEIYDGTRCLTSFGSKNYDAIYIRVIYLISLKSNTTHIFLTSLRKSKMILIIRYL